MPSVADFFAVPSVDLLVAVLLRLIVATALGGILGMQRELAGKAAGLRTHMLVALGAAVFVLCVAGAAPAGDEGRVIQGVAAGIGFIGAGTILKRRDEDEVIGLTTAAGLWLTAAIGVAAAVTNIWLAMMATAVAWIVLNVMMRIERRLHGRP